MHKHSDIYKTTLRKEHFRDKVSTRIWYEEPSPDNPYIAKRSLCHGYDLLDLMRSCTFIEVLYLLFRGELPSNNQAVLLETLMIALINPGPRHPATRAAMSSAVSKTHPSHILPLALSCLSGDYLGAAEVEKSMRFIKRSVQRDPATLAHFLLGQYPKPAEGDWHVGPGFGSRFGGVDRLAQAIASSLCALSGAGQALHWGCAFAHSFFNQDAGWLTPGIAAAAFLDLGFHPRSGPGLFQVLSSPGLLAHGLEFANQPITAMPFVDNQHYIIERS
jgi:citrate synthase